MMLVNNPRERGGNIDEGINMAGNFWRPINHSFREFNYSDRRRSAWNIFQSIIQGHVGTTHNAPQ
ncbi:hypothetical protein AN958_10638 [Leucoagaricus sp. SymC.cos]|nr:hypothetical protein AN958_10638 [Leucoagaricus sp. SymC.cos]